MSLATLPRFLHKTLLRIGHSLYFLVCAGIAIASSAQTFSRLATFDGADGAWPYGTTLIQNIDGTFAGTTMYGVAPNVCTPFGCGTIFRVSQEGHHLTSLSLSSVDGFEPVAGLLLASNGKVYGTTTAGGANGQGTVFELNEVGELTTLYDFCSQPNCVDGSNPGGTLVEGTDGNLYGTTMSGGANSSSCSSTNGCGTVFKLSTSGELTELYSFCAQSDCIDGFSPFAGLVQGNDGRFYGTTVFGGGSMECSGGCGTIFRITSTGLLTTLHSFDGTDGQDPEANLAQGTDGNFYGTTSAGGSNLFGGTVFKITSAGALSTLYRFCSQLGCTDGSLPNAGLVQATDGNFYGTTSYGGGFELGTIFQIEPSGTLVVLHSFQDNEGSYPSAGLLQGTNGSFYGTTYSGGDLNCNSGYGCGTLFRLNVGLGPFVALVRYSGRVGETGGILGQGFTGTTSVALNGIPAQFKVVSDTFIRATVPREATSGYVTVTTPSGSLTSNKPFQVIP